MRDGEKRYGRDTGRQAEGWQDALQKEREALYAEVKAREDALAKWTLMADRLSICQLPDKIKLDVGGQLFATSLKTLTCPQRQHVLWPLETAG